MKYVTGIIQYVTFIMKGVHISVGGFNISVVLSPWCGGRPRAASMSRINADKRYPQAAGLRPPLRSLARDTLARDHFSNAATVRQFSAVR
jgi:hypothetical protein